MIFSSYHTKAGADAPAQLFYGTIIFMATRSQTNQPQPHSEVQTLEERLHRAGLKATQPRLLVLQLLQELGGHRSIDDLLKELQARQTPLPRASVYNIIATLVSRGLVMLADAGPGPALYEVSLNWHHHFVCISCGRIIDIPCVVGSKPCLLPDSVPGMIEETQIIFRGRCADCLTQQDQLPMQLPDAR
jgi:Fe2+ or Zn2+ uptake regulation protein